MPTPDKWPRLVRARISGPDHYQSRSVAQTAFAENEGRAPDNISNGTQADMWPAMSWVVAVA